MNKKTIVLMIFIVFFTVLFAQEEEVPLVSNIFQDTFILDALSDISAQTGVTIIADTMVTGFVTMELNEVPLEQALKMILMPSGYTFVKMDDFYFVGAPDPANPAFRFIAETEVVEPQYISVSAATALLPSFYSPFIKADSETNSLTITAPRDIIERFKEDLSKIDKPSRQIKVSVLVTEVSKEFLNQIGLDQLGYTFGANEQFNPDWTAQLGLTLGNFAIQTDMFGTIVANIKLLEEQQKAKISADPWIIVNNGKSANLFVGQREVIILQPEEGAAATTQTVDVGVGLDITPRIIGDDQIEISLSPTISHFTNGRTTRALSTKRSELSTTLYARSGQTILISGMTVEDESDTYRGVPFLDQIPILRYFFGTKEQSHSQREMLIFLTVEIL